MFVLSSMFLNLFHWCVVAKPIDLLARYISAEDDDLAIEMHEPYTYLNVCVTHSVLCVVSTLVHLCKAVLL